MRPYVLMFPDHAPVVCDTAAEALREIIETMLGLGITAADRSPWCPAVGLLLAETVNCLAKQDNPWWYGLKAAAVVAAAELGCALSEGDDGTIALHHPLVGSAWFHDPYNEIRNLSRSRRVKITGYRPWDKKIRQPWAIDRLAGHDVRIARAMRRVAE